MADTVETERIAAAPIPNAPDLDKLREAAAGCTACPLYRNATQTVFGEGPERAQLMFIGEQPGDSEDLSGHPFVGPAGKMFDRCVAEAGIERGQSYVTNTVKHFKWVPRGARRIHSKPNTTEIAACFPWLEAELAAVKPEIVVALGATAAQALFGRAFRVTRKARPNSACAAVAPSATIRSGFTAAISASSQGKQAVISIEPGLLWIRLVPRGTHLKCLTALVT